MLSRPHLISILAKNARERARSRGGEDYGYVKVDMTEREAYEMVEMEEAKTARTSAKVGT